MKRALSMLAATAAGIIAIALSPSAAFAAGPPYGLSYTATDAITYSANEPNVSCFLESGASCSSAGEFGMPYSDVEQNTTWFQAKHGYTVVYGGLNYTAKGHQPITVDWYGGHRALTRSFNHVTYYLRSGHIEVVHRPNYRSTVSFRADGTYKEVIRQFVKGTWVATTKAGHGHPVLHDGPTVSYQLGAHCIPTGGSLIYGTGSDAQKQAHYMGSIAGFFNLENNRLQTMRVNMHCSAN